MERETIGLILSKESKLSNLEVPNVDRVMLHHMIIYLTAGARSY